MSEWIYKIGGVLLILSASYNAVSEVWGVAGVVMLCTGSIIKRLDLLTRDIEYRLEKEEKQVAKLLENLKSKDSEKKEKD